MGEVLAHLVDGLPTRVVSAQLSHHGRHQLLDESDLVTRATVVEDLEPLNESLTSETPCTLLYLDVLVLKFAHCGISRSVLGDGLGLVPSPRVRPPGGR